MLSKFRVMAVTIAIAVMTLGLVAVPALADPGDDDGCHEHKEDCGGGGDGGRDETLYDVVISVDISGESTDPWLTFGKGTSIGLNDASEGRVPGEFTNLSFFAALPGNSPPFSADDGAICFPSAPFAIHQGRVQEGRGGRAQAGFWFHGWTHDTVDGVLVKVLYNLLLTGDFPADPLPPTAINQPIEMNMTAWELGATNEGKAIKDISCIGEGATNVTIMVTGPV